MRYIEKIKIKLKIMNKKEKNTETPLLPSKLFQKG